MSFAEEMNQLANTVSVDASEPEKFKAAIRSIIEKNVREYASKGYGAITWTETVLFPTEVPRLTGIEFVCGSISKELGLGFTSFIKENQLTIIIKWSDHIGKFLNISEAPNLLGIDIHK